MFEKVKIFIEKRSNFKERNIFILALLLALDLLITLSIWIGENYVSISYAVKNLAVCPPYFKSCTKLYFFDNIQFTSGHNIFYLVLFFILFLAIYFLFTKRYGKFMVLISLLLLYKFIYLYFLTYLSQGNSSVLGLLFGTVFVFSIYKIFYLRILFVGFYFCAGLIKLDSGYFYGTAFSSIKNGLPLVPDFLIQYVGLFFIFLCFLIPPFLLSNRKIFRYTSLALLTVFHMYSILVVGYKFPLLIIPILWLLFYFEKTDFTLNYKYIKDYVSIIVILLMFTMQLIPFFIKGDAKLTGEGYKYGFYMYDANHKCFSRTKISFKDGAIKENYWVQDVFMYNCDPYLQWYRLNNSCKFPTVNKISLKYYHSVNGEDYKNIIDEENVCLLHYKPFSHNDWIILDWPKQ